MIVTKKGSFILALFFLVFLAHGVLNAQSGIFDRVGIIPGHGSYSSLPEESVDLFTGNLTLRYRDIYLPGPNGLDVEVWRVYNSKILFDKPDGQQYPIVQAYPKTMLGIGWTMHMGMVHNYSSQNPVIEFPDGRRETTFKNWTTKYGYTDNINLTKDFLKYDRVNFILYFQNGVTWTFGRAVSIPLADGSSESVRVVTSIKNAYGNEIVIEHDPDDNYRSIKKITDAMESDPPREVYFDKSYQGSNPAKLTKIRIRNYNNDHDVEYAYSVGSFANGFYKLTSLTPPGLPSTTYEYNDGQSYNYELTRLTTSYGGILEYGYGNHDFYFNTTKLDSKVVYQKKITFNPGDQVKTWTYSYPTYQGVTYGTATVQGPEYSTSVTNCAYDSSCPWRIGLELGRTVSDGSLSETLAWTYQQISASNWTVLGTNMGTAKGPLVSSVREAPQGDATLKREYVYTTDGPKLYGLPSRINLYVNDSATPKTYKDLTYYYDSHPAFLTKYIFSVESELDYSGGGVLLRKTVLSYFAETGKWGALSQVKRWKSASSYLTWDYTYNGADPKNISISVDAPGGDGITSFQISFGVKKQVDAPAFTRLTRDISPYNSYFRWEKNQHDGKMTYQYDDLGRITQITPTDESGKGDTFNSISYNWRPGGENKVEITRGTSPNINKVTRYWDGMGRDLGATESGDGTTLYYRKTLDAEGRVKEETSGSLDPAHKYSFVYDAIGRLTQITDPLGKATTISYSNHIRTVTDPLTHATTYEYNDLPGSPTKLTDAKGKVADYTYDALGRLTNVVFNGSRPQSYEYDWLDNVLSETHPETGLISYSYDSQNRLSQKSWGGTTLNCEYNASGQLERLTGAEQVTYSYDGKGRFWSASGASGWTRNGFKYNCWGSVTEENIAIPGLYFKTVKYAYDGNNNLVGTTYPDGKTAQAPHGGLNRPTSLTFNQTSIVNSGSISYGPNKMIAGMGLGNGTTFSSTFKNNGMPNVVSLMLGASPLYNATYGYDEAGNITSISSTAPVNPTLNTTFTYDELNRLIYAKYTAAQVTEFNYEYDEYGNMKKATKTGAPPFEKSYDSQNRIIGFNYDARGNLTSANGKNYFWDSQNRLSYITDISGQILGEYRYDDRGLRLTAFPPLPDIDVVGYPSGGAPGAEFTSSLNTPSDKTFTLQNLGHATLTLNAENPLTFSGQDAGLFSVQQQPASSIAPNQSTTFVIRFLPTSTGDKSAVLEIRSNDIDENPYTITLKGYCEPEINVIGVPSGGTYDFGTVTIGESEVNTFTLQNTGTASLILYGAPISIEGPDADNFYLEKQADSAVAASGSTTFIVRFAPNSEGVKNATISIENNDLNENPYIVNLRGTGELGPAKISEESAFALTFPNGGEELEAGAIRDITWSGGKSAKAVKIEYSTDNGSSYRTIAARAANIGTYPWKVPADLSPVCLIRISDANGAPIAPLYISYEFNFKVSVPKDAAQKATGFTFRAGVRDPKTKNYQAAEVSFVPDEVRGSENLLFNQALAELQSLDLFLNAWHHARIQYDMSNYSGSVWIDDQPVVSNVPLTVDLKVKSSAEISIQSSTDIQIKLWLDDVEVKFIDQSSGQATVDNAAYKPVLRDHFGRYESLRFPDKGGWRWVMESPDEDKGIPNKANLRERRTAGNEVSTSAKKSAENTSAVDESEFVSSAKSFRLENQESAPAVVSKRISLPARIPFVVSADNFSIVAGGVAVQGTEGSPGLADIERGRSRDRGKEGKENSRSSGRQRETLGARGGATARTTDASAPANNSPAGKSRTRTFSASPAGGTYYIYSFDGRLLAEYNLYGTCVRDYIYFGGQLIAEFDTVGSQIYYYTSDQISSTRIVTNSTGVVVYAAAHDPYGGIQQTWPGNTFNPTPKFSGKERDGESDLDYFGARYYDKSQYRFISVDPIINSNAFYKSPQRMNLYGYCVNSPLSFMDIDGRVIVPVALPGSGGATLHTYLDSFFIGTVGLFIDWCASWGISLEFNNAFRTQEEQDRIRKKNPIAAKISLHSAGWAFDIEKEYWESLTELEQSIVTSIAFLLGMESGAQFNDPNHFYADPWGIDTKGLEARKVAIQDACKLLSYYEYGVAGLSSLELYLIYGVFTEAAAWNVILKAEIDLTSRH